jgi:hypothetical protein
MEDDSPPIPEEVFEAHLKTLMDLDL